MKKHLFSSQDFLYQKPKEIIKYLTKSDFSLIIALENHTTESIELLEILRFNFEKEELYEWCVLIKREIDLRVSNYNLKEANENQ
jgi:hypothetical protein